MRRLKFQMIADSRYTDNLTREINRLVCEVNIQLAKLADIRVSTSDISELDFGEAKQKRITFYIEKYSRKTTWNDIYKATNSVKAVPYTFI